MIDLVQADQQTIMAFGRQLLTDYRDSLSSFEEAAQTTVERIYDTFRQPNGDPAFALVRIFRLSDFQTLPEDAQASVDSNHERWMALAGTYGIEPAWCDRRSSHEHKVLNLGLDQNVMVSVALYQMALEVGVEMPEIPAELDLPKSTMVTRFFYVENAPDNPYIPAQEGFVKPYGIRSVLGIGTGFVSNSAYMLIGFMTVNVSEETGAKFAQLAPFVSTLLAIYDEQQIWAG